MKSRAHCLQKILGYMDFFITGAPALSGERRTKKLYTGCSYSIHILYYPIKFFNYPVNISI